MPPPYKKKKNDKNAEIADKGKETESNEGDKDTAMEVDGESGDGNQEQNGTISRHFNPDGLHFT